MDMICKGRLLEGARRFDCGTEDLEARLHAPTDRQTDRHNSTDRDTDTDHSRTGYVAHESKHVKTRHITTTHKSNNPKP